MRFLRLYSAIFLFFLSASCKANSDESTFFFVGRIDKSAKDEFIAKSDKVNTLVITSQGGEISESIDIARIVSRNEIKVIVKKYCLSACAQYILPAAQSIEIKDKAIIGFHSSPLAIQNSLLDSGFLDEAKKYEYLAKKERNFYKYLSISSENGLFWANSVNPICFILSKNNSKLALIASRYEFSVPSQKRFEEWSRKKVTGFWVNNRLDLIHSIEQSIPRGVNASFVLENDTKRAAESLPECSAPDHF